MLDVVHDVLREDTFFEMTGHGAGENGVFAEIFVVAAIARLARGVNAAAKRHVVTLRPQFAPDQRAIFICGIRVPACSRRQIAWQSGRVTTIFSA